MSKVLITGINSFTGRYVAASLVSDGYDVFGTVSSSQALSACDFPDVSKVYVSTLGEGNQFDDILTKLVPDYVIHLAAVSFVGHDSYESFYSVNVVGTENLLRSIYNCLPNVKRVVVASSANIYGNASSGGQILESQSPKPLNHYAISKVAMENVIDLYSSCVPMYVTRPFNYTGVGQNVKFLIPKIVEHFKNKETSLALGNIDVERDFSDVRYVSQIYVGLLSHQGANCEVFNICSGETVSINHIIELLQTKTGHQLQINVNSDFIRPNEIKSICGSPLKLDKYFAGINKIPLKSTLDWMLE